MFLRIVLISLFIPIFVEMCVRMIAPEEVSISSTAANLPTDETEEPTNAMVTTPMATTHMDTTPMDTTPMATAGPVTAQSTTAAAETSTYSFHL